MYFRKQGVQERIEYGLFGKYNLVFMLRIVAGAFLGVLGDSVVYHNRRNSYREAVF